MTQHCFIDYNIVLCLIILCCNVIMLTKKHTHKKQTTKHKTQNTTQNNIQQHIKHKIRKNNTI